MNLLRSIFVLLLLLVTHAKAQTNAPINLERAISEVTERLASRIAQHQGSKVCVLDFYDLQGNVSELGRYIGEEMTMNLTATNRPFQVLDRAHMTRILKELKLGEDGFIDSAQAKQMGKLAGVDAFIFGTIVRLEDTLQLNCKLIATETEEVQAGEKIQIKMNDGVEKLLSKPARGRSNSVDPDDAAKVVKVFGDLRISVKSLRVVDKKSYVASFAVENTNPKKQMWIALAGQSSRLSGSVSDPKGFEFEPVRGATGISTPPPPFHSKGHLGWGTLIPDREEMIASVPFSSARPATPGVCKLQLTFLTTDEPDEGQVLTHTLSINIEAE